MNARFLILFGFGLAEMFILAWITAETSLLVTLAIALGSALLGSALLRHQGTAAWRKAMEQMATGASPGDHLTDGLLILVAAVLLIVPGVISDAVGLLLMIPAARALLRPRLAARFGSRMVFQTAASHWKSAPDTDADSDENIIDAEAFRPAGNAKLTSQTETF